MFERVLNAEEEALIIYSSGERRGLTFNNIPIDSSNITFITVLDNKIASIQTCAKEKHSLLFAEDLLLNLGTPTEILTDTQNLDEKISHQVFEQFHTVFPDNTKWNENELNTIEYPYLFFWDRKDTYYIFTMTLDWSGRIRNQYYPVVTKEAYRANKVFGYKYPPTIDFPLFKFMK